MVQTDASNHVVTRPAELVDLIGQATASRATSATKKNDTSSRSHCLLTLTIQNKLYPMAQPGKILVVDLAGSERASDRESHSREVSQRTCGCDKKIDDADLVRLFSCSGPSGWRRARSSTSRCHASRTVSARGPWCEFNVVGPPVCGDDGPRLIHLFPDQ